MSTHSHSISNHITVVAAKARALGLFAAVEIHPHCVVCEAKASAAPAQYRVTVEGSRWYVEVTTADRWLSHASQIAFANSPEDAVGQVRSTINERSIRASRYAQANLYSPPLRNLIDDALARWHRPARDR